MNKVKRYLYEKRSFYGHYLVLTSLINEIIKMINALFAEILILVSISVSFEKIFEKL